MLAIHALKQLNLRHKNNKQVRGIMYSASSGSTGKSKVRNLKRMTVMLVVLVIAGGSAVYFAYKYNQAKEDVTRLSDPQAAAKAETDKLVAKVSALVEVPQGETPTVATVSDASKLKTQAFFAHAENDDKVLIYTQAKKAILYRPSTNKIVEIAPVNIGASETKTTE